MVRLSKVTWTSNMWTTTTMGKNPKMSLRHQLLTRSVQAVPESISECFTDEILAFVQEEPLRRCFLCRRTQIKAPKTTDTVVAFALHLHLTTHATSHHVQKNVMIDI